ncbi:hypothetical protein TMP248_110095 [Tenacibaculum maritimum]|uniref:DUF6933 domain-containing protein n=1 Tax=Tenacibaculum maritimum TaxID=107401 RepID=UPI0012E62274|nr:hypothetical protein [Tenacibaculum maritimum]CAA0163558.1 hypothetical protein TMP248_110095 [Tenacibaculum maritimum]CAA0173079.1 hypothetical protein FS0810_140024 [Tenacibaculum maritimum]
MITLFCSNKLQKYIGFKENQIKKDSLSELNSWNVHLFTVNRKKCLFFMNHQTYFSFVVYDIKKPDIKKINELFVNGFITELKKLELITPEQEEVVKSRFTEVFFHKSINNRKVIGNMNNLIQIIDYYKYNYDDFQDFLSQDTFLNTYLLKKEDDYFEAKDAIKDKINQLFNETING